MAGLRAGTFQRRRATHRIVERPGSPKQEQESVSSSGAIAERRIAMLIDASVSRLPPLLTAYAGMNPGFIIAHVTAAALSSENKSLAHPASLDILPMSANQEDHVSMETFAARRLKPMIRNTAHILGSSCWPPRKGWSLPAAAKFGGSGSTAYAAARAVRSDAGRPVLGAGHRARHRGGHGGLAAGALRTFVDLLALWTPA